MPHKINTAAISLFEQFGQDFTLDQLSEMAETSRATLYRRIGSKDSLLKKLATEGLINFNQQSDIKSRILAATRIIVVRHGFLNCTMDQIANQAGLGIATLYRHFAEKEKLLLAYVDARKNDFNIEYEIEQYADFETGLLAVIKTMLTFISKNDDLAKLMFFGAPEERKYIRGLRNASNNGRSTFSILGEFLLQCQQKGDIRADISVKDLTNSLVGQILQFAITAPTHFNRPLDIDNDANTIIQIYCNGIQVSPKEVAK